MKNFFNNNKVCTITSKKKLSSLKSIFFLFLLSVTLLLFSGCGDEIPICSEQDTTYTKYLWDEDIEECIVSKEITENVCGNGIKEDGETYCSCPDDVSNKELPIDQGGCSGNKGDFLEYKCSDETKQCELKITEKVKKISKLLTLKSGSSFAIDGQVNYFVPFMKDRHTVDIDFMLKNILDTPDIKIKDLTIRKVYLVTQANELLGEKTIDKKFKDLYDNFKTSISLDSFSIDTFNVDMRNTNLKVLISYTKETYSKTDGVYSLSKSENLNIEIKQVFESKFQIIDPQNKNEEIEISGGWG